MRVIGESNWKQIDTSLLGSVSGRMVVEGLACTGRAWSCNCENKEIFPLDNVNADKEYFTTLFTPISLYTKKQDH
jgi:hypothetical protein